MMRSHVAALAAATGVEAITEVPALGRFMAVATALPVEDTESRDGRWRAPLSAEASIAEQLTGRRPAPRQSEHTATTTTAAIGMPTAIRSARSNIDRNRSVRAALSNACRRPCDSTASASQTLLREPEGAI